MDTAHHWPQGNGVVRPVENSLEATEKKPRPEKEKALNCPRCNSTNTKFCYYNNYSLSQPRYFCKTCRRYWTQGGTLRNVPVGGGSRKARRSYTSSNSSSKKAIPNLSPPRLSFQTPKIYDQGHDLNLAYDDQPIFNGVSGIADLSFDLDPKNPNYTSPSSSHVKSPNSNSVYTSSTFPILDFKTSQGFSLHGLEFDHNVSVNMQAVEDHHHHNTLFPLEELKAVSSSELDQLHYTQGETNNGYWNPCWLGVPGDNI